MIDDVVKAFEISREKLFKNIPQSMYMNIVDRVLKGKIDKSAKKLLEIEVAQEVINSLKEFSKIN